MVYYFYIVCCLALISCGQDISSKVIDSDNSLDDISGYLIANSKNLNDTVLVADRFELEVKQYKKGLYLSFKTKKVNQLLNELNQFYNQRFNQINEIARFNTWNMNQKEYFLYKQSDSTIFVNVYRKTYK